MKNLHPDKKTLQRQLSKLKKWFLGFDSTAPKTPQWRVLKETHRNALVTTHLHIERKEL